MKGREKGKEASDDDLPQEKWLAAFRSPSLSPAARSEEGTAFVREFRAPGFYEAYDTVLTFAERMNVEVLWFREKRSCGAPYMNRNYPPLEAICTWCNRRFRQEPIPCAYGGCAGEFCSRECVQEHAARNNHHHHY